MLPATTLPAAVPASQDAVDSAVSAGQSATPQPPAVSRTSWRDHRKTAPRDADAALVKLQAMGSLWRNADGVIEEDPVPPGGIVVIGAKPGAYAPGLDAAAAPRAAGPVTGGAGLGILPALLSPGRPASPARFRCQIWPAATPGRPPSTARSAAPRSPPPRLAAPAGRCQDR